MTDETIRDNVSQVQQPLLTIIDKAKRAFNRVGVVLEGAPQWQTSVVESMIQAQPNAVIHALGNRSLSCVQSPLKRGQSLLGQELDILIIDPTEFDANGFSAAVGALRGGGVLILLPSQPASDAPCLASQQWLNQRYAQLMSIHENGAVFNAGQPIDIATYHLPALEKNAEFLEQQEAARLIEKVLTGHRKRPLVLTADRGRGKSSALGIASGQLMKARTIDIVVTAPSLKAIAPVFEQAKRQLLQHNHDTPAETSVQSDKMSIATEQSRLRFVAPDELLSGEVSCDLLLVDEAAAIPVPLLKQMVERYHRAVFSSTVHGYEGSGRGFSLKFVEWLFQQRKGSVRFHMQQPIRWAQEDDLEKWVYDSFLLNTEIASVPSESRGGGIQLERLPVNELLEEPETLRQCFALLVNAHYQTSPNDLFQIFDDPQVALYVARHNHNNAGRLDDEQGYHPEKGQVIGCLLSVDEGNLEPQLVSDLQLGKRRPKGHLVPCLLANHLSISESACQRSRRIMRIAVHPECQQQGVGGQMLQQLYSLSHAQVDFLSTSFGVTDELFDFWNKQAFRAVYLGSSRDKSSGCFSLVMVKPISDVSSAWVALAQEMCVGKLSLQISDVHQTLSNSLWRRITTSSLNWIEVNPAVQEQQTPAFVTNMIHHYAQGGNSFESCSPWIHQWLLGANTQLAVEVEDIVIDLVVKKLSWANVAKCHNLPGRKQVEHKLRTTLLSYFS